MNARPQGLVVVALATMAAAPAAAQEVFRCTSPDGKVSYQQAPCPKTDEGRRIDATPANTDHDPAQRERVLKQGEEAGKRLEERAAREREEARLRAEEREAQREREAQAREAAREEPVYVIGWPGNAARPLPRPLPPARPQPRPLPAPPSR